MCDSGCWTFGQGLGLCEISCPAMPSPPVGITPRVASHPCYLALLTGRYVKTVANPAAAAAVSQEREVLLLRRNRLGPNEAPIPLPRATHVVIPTAPPGAGGGGGTGGKGGAGSSLPAKRKSLGAGGSSSGNAAAGGSGGGGMVLLESDLFEDDARQRAIELVRAMGEWEGGREGVRLLLELGMWRVDERAGQAVGELAGRKCTVGQEGGGWKGRRWQGLYCAEATSGNGCQAAKGQAEKQTV